MIGDKIAHYKILEKLGSGGMGVVYKAEDTELRSIVALKFLPPELTRDDVAKQRLEREAQALASLDHPNICTVHALHHAPDGRPFFCMAYYPGQTLQEKLASGPLDVREALDIAHAAADGLAEAHSKGVIHRDIKPGNIIITEEGTVKLLDFGIARLIDRTRVTRRGMTPGTLHYMSPEQLSGGDVDERSDVFSLGTVLYEMLTGRVPFEADRQDAVSYQIINVAAEPITRHRRDVPKRLQKILDRAMAKKPRSRYGSAREFRSELELVMGKRLPHPRLRRAAALGAVLLVAAVVGRNLMNGGGVPTAKRVLMLPFTMEGTSLGATMLGGLQETLNQQLVQLERVDDSFWVLRAADMSLRDSVDPAEAGGVYGVNLLLTGAVRETQGTLVVNLALLDAENLQSIEQQSISATGADLATLQIDLPTRVLEMLGTEVTDRTIGLLAAGGTSDASAYRLYLEGWGQLLDGHSPNQKLTRSQGAGVAAGLGLQAAINSFEQAVESDPLYARAYRALAEACWKRYKTDETPSWRDLALDHCHKALELQSEFSAAYTTLGRIHSGTGDWASAADAFGQTLAIDPVDAVAIRGLAMAYNELGRSDDAVATYQHAIRSRPDYWPTRVYLGYLYYVLGQYESAVAEYEAVVSLTPGDYSARSNLGSFYYLMGQLDDAERMFKKSFDIKKSYGACLNLGTLYYRDGRYADAARMCEWAAEYDEDSTDYLVWGNLAQAYSRIPEERHKARENYQKAIAIAEAARDSDRANPIPVAFLAGYYADIADTARSNQCIEEAVSLGPRNSEVLFRAGHASAKIGEREKALKWLARAVENGYSTEEILQDPELEELRQDPRFEYLVRSEAGDAGAASAKTPVEN